MKGKFLALSLLNLVMIQTINAQTFSIDCDKATYNPNVLEFDLQKETGSFFKSMRGHNPVHIYVKNGKEPFNILRNGEKSTKIHDGYKTYFKKPGLYKIEAIDNSQQKSECITKYFLPDTIYINTCESNELDLFD